MDRFLRKDSDDVLVDFHDVFGGPPRRASMQEWRNIISSERGEGRTAAADLVCLGDPWESQGERPVFGGESHSICGGSRRSLNVSENFFDDIFGGSDSSGSAPRGSDSDMFSGSPRSWVLSPVRLLPEALRSSNVPSQHSLPVKVSRPMDSPSVGPLNGESYAHSSKTSFRYQGTTTQVQEDMKKGTRPFYSSSPLSPKLVFGSEESLSSIKPGDKEDQKEHTKNLQGVADISQFHFSIYRWASKGVPVATPLRRVNSIRMREKARPESLYSDEHRVKTENIVSSSTKKNVPMDTLSGMEREMQDNDLTEKSSWQNEMEGVQTVEEVTLPTDESKIQHTCVPNGSMEEDFLPDAVPQTTLHQHLSQVMDMEPEEPSKRELKPLPSVLNDKDSGKGNHEDNVQKIGGRDRKLRKSKPSSMQGNAANDDRSREEGSKSLNDGLMNKGSVRGSGTNVGGNHSSDRVRGKVKEYIHIFNQDNLPKGKQDVLKQNESIREKERAIPNVRKTIHTVGKLDDVHQAQSFRKAQDDGNATSNREENNSSKNLFSDASSEQKSSSESSTEYASDEIRATVIEVEESFNENFMIKELGKNEIKGREPDDGVEDIQALDEKIGQWSRGKEGNIRSLLSTLQYVLWPNSGWNPVPLVDIIEGPAVKRAYQKALLCLHPDKLQQKGASSHQKHAAHLIYEIFQVDGPLCRMLGLISVYCVFSERPNSDNKA